MITIDLIHDYLNFDGLSIFLNNLKKTFASKKDIPQKYIVSGEQTSTSNDAQGENIYTFTNADGTTSTLTVKNGTQGSQIHCGSIISGNTDETILIETELLSAKINDLYINTDTWDVYHCTQISDPHSNWIYEGNIKGASGIPKIDFTIKDGHLFVDVTSSDYDFQLNKNGHLYMTY